MTYFLKNGNTFRPSAEAALDLHYTLPVGTYTVKKDMFGNFFLEAIDNFTFPGKRYGDNIRNTDRIFSTFKSRDVSTGALFSGEKGSGKSLLAKSIAIKGYENDVPTIVVNEPWCGEDFNQFVQMIEQECIIIFDEFEKVYNSDEQAAVLTLLDGVYPTKKLFILTCNDKYRIDHHMKNRPGRIYYMIEFKGLAPDFIVEYCEDNLNNKEHINTLKKLSTMFVEFNFDMLKAIVEEMNRYNESPQQALELLNAKPEFDNRSRYKIELMINGKVLHDDHVSPTDWNGNPLTGGVVIDYLSNQAEDDWTELHFTPNELKELNPEDDKFIFINGANQKLTLTRIREAKFDYWGVF
jgi:hypothetical protein